MIKIKNIQAATLWGYNVGIRTHYEQTDAALCESLFLDFLLTKGFKVWKGRSSRDIIGLNFDFGTRSYEEELKHVQKMEPSERKEELLEKIEAHKDKYVKMSKDELRTLYYTEGVDVHYKEETIHYKMLYRTPSKAKVGNCMFIREELYDAAYDWMTMGLGARMPEHGAKIVEMSAYAPLSTSTIVGKFHLPVENVLILKDQDSIFRALAKVVRAVPTKDGKMKCVVENAETDVVNTLWDGMALIEPDVLPDWCNGMALLRNHFFKACAFKTRIQQFFRDWCGDDYREDLEIVDMFGNTHKLIDIKVITTDNACKWLNIMGHPIRNNR